MLVPPIVPIMRPPAGGVGPRADCRDGGAGRTDEGGNGRNGTRIARSPPLPPTRRAGHAVRAGRAAPVTPQPGVSGRRGRPPRGPREGQKWHKNRPFADPDRLHGSGRSCRSCRSCGHSGLRWRPPPAAGMILPTGLRRMERGPAQILPCGPLAGGSGGKVCTRRGPDPPVVAGVAPLSGLIPQSGGKLHAKAFSPNRGVTPISASPFPGPAEAEAQRGSLGM